MSISSLPTTRCDKTSSWHAVFRHGFKFVPVVAEILADLAIEARRVIPSAFSTRADFSYRIGPASPRSSPTTTRLECSCGDPTFDGDSDADSDGVPALLAESRPRLT